MYSLFSWLWPQNIEEIEQCRSLDVHYENDDVLMFSPGDDTKTKSYQHTSFKDLYFVPVKQIPTETKLTDVQKL